jgi:hypothetical protein|tara:strand:- start:8623 stop:8790 length:168 start_codon:yes stop_codon:yes gene_type:complete
VGAVFRPPNNKEGKNMPDKTTYGTGATGFSDGQTKLVSSLKIMKKKRKKRLKKKK